jgi:hypothetical protein
MTILSTSTPESEMLSWLNEQLNLLFPEMAWPLRAFYWVAKQATGARNRSLAPAAAGE